MSAPTPGSSRPTPAQRNCAFKTFVGQSSILQDNIPANNQPEIYANARISQIQFQMLKSSDVTRASHIEVVQRSFYQPDRQVPIPWGPLDNRMGTSAKDGICTTCNKGLTDCIGHFGHVSLELPVFHIGYIKEVQRVLQTICKKCSRVLLPNDNFRSYFLSKMVHSDRRVKANIRDDILDIAKRCKTCVHCGARNGQIKKLPGMFKLIHDLRAKETKRDRDVKAEREMREKEQNKARRKARAQGLGLDGSYVDLGIVGEEQEIDMGDGKRTAPPETWKDEFHDSFRTAIKYNSAIGDYLNNAVLEVSPLLALKLFTSIPDEDCYLLNLDPTISRPEDMIVTQLIVPPVCLRPSVAMGTSGSNEDDITVKLGDIIYINNFIKTCFQRGMPTSTIVENWDYLQQQVAMIVNSDLPGFNKAAIAAKPIRSLTQRLKGKTGRFRGNLSGKRVDFSSRTVISPDPNLRIDQVGVPDRVAKVLTFPERVFAHNIEELRRAVINGPDVHPGANMVEFQNGAKIFLKFGDRNKVASMIKEGDVVERHLRDNDIVLFNRQPSLHRMSIMAHRAKVLQWRTFRFNESVCAPYNADFDGDEMNLHLPQTLEAKAEAEQLMAVMHNLVTPRNGEPLITATQDFITSAFLITSKDRFISRGKFCFLVAGMGDADERVRTPVPAIVKPMALWTGKQVFSLLLRPNEDEDEHEADGVSKQPWPIVTIELKAKNNTRLHPMDPVDGYVVVRNSELMCGSIDKDALGGSKKGMFYQLIRAGPHGPVNAARFLNRLAKFSSRFITSQGFSIGIDDVTPSHHLSALKNVLIETGYNKCQQNIRLYEKGKLALRPGCNEVQTLESLLLGELSAIREDAGSECFRELNLLYNSPLIMAISGSKGSKINISQMTACVGQQAISGSRIPEGFHLRTLPHFPKFSRDPDAKGFVANSFFTGLTATEFFFHTMGGREGLVDTAVKTAETGYMQRRLMKALEDLCVQYDGSVRTSERNIVQFRYGDDGLDPVLMAAGVLPVNFPVYFEQCRAAYSSVVVSTGSEVPKANLTAVLSSVLPSHQLEDAINDHTGDIMAKGGVITIGTNAQTDFMDWVGYAATNKEAVLATEKLEHDIKYAPARLKELSRPNALLLPHEVLATITAFCNHKVIASTCTAKFLESLMDFARGEHRVLKEMLEVMGITQDIVDQALANTGSKTKVNQQRGAYTFEEALNVMAQSRPVFKSHLNIFLNGSFAKYVSSQIEPGTAVGAIGGQSIGEPGTQMTLKSVDWADTIVLMREGRWEVVRIGEWIDGLMQCGVAPAVYMSPEEVAAELAAPPHPDAGLLLPVAESEVDVEGEYEEPAASSDATVLLRGATDGKAEWAPAASSAASDIVLCFSGAVAPAVSRVESVLASTSVSCTGARWLATQVPAAPVFVTAPVIVAFGAKVQAACASMLANATAATLLEEDVCFYHAQTAGKDVVVITCASPAVAPLRSLQVALLAAQRAVQNPSLLGKWADAAAAMRRRVNAQQQQAAEVYANAAVERVDEVDAEMGQTRLLDIASQGVYVPSVAPDGTVSLKAVTAVTKHLPINADGTRTLLRVSTRMGREVMATKAKSFLTRVDGVLQATRGDALEVGTRLPVSYQLPALDQYASVESLQWLITEGEFANAPTELVLDEQIGFLIGAFVASGSASKTYVTFKSQDPMFCARVAQLAEQSKDTLQIALVESEAAEVRVHSSLLIRIMRRYCGPAHAKRIPAFMFSATTECARAFVEAIFSAHGAVQSDAVSVTYAYKQVLKDVQLLLTRFGIFSTVEAADICTLTVRDRNIAMFAKAFVFTAPAKQEKLQEVAAMVKAIDNGTHDKIPGCTAPTVDALLRDEECSDLRAELETGLIPRSKLAALLEKDGGDSVPEEVRGAVEQPLFYDEVLEIKEVPPTAQYVYDLTVEDTKTFMMADGLMMYDTFHFAGVASMNITLGVPRIKEIINASKKINTPIITAPLECDTDVKTARIVKGRIETTKLGEIAKSIEAIFSASGCHLRVVVDMEAIENLQLNINVRKVATALESAKKLKLKKKVTVLSDCVIEISPPDLQLNAGRGALASASASSVLQSLQALKKEIAEVVVEGIPTVSRAVINDDGSGKYHLLVEGYDLAAVMATLGVRGKEATSNHVMEVWKVLGIEAARRSIVSELNTTFESHGLNVDPRHMALLADIMTYRGEVLGITRFGIAKMKESVLMLASFEKTADHLFEAALRGTTDNISGVSECIIMGSPMPVGTGLFNLVQRSMKPSAPPIKDYDAASATLRRKGKNRDAASVMLALEDRTKLEEKDDTAPTFDVKALDAKLESLDKDKKTAAKTPTKAKSVVPAVPDIVEKKREAKVAPADPFAKKAPLMTAFARLTL